MTENKSKTSSKIAMKKRNVQIWTNNLVHLEKSNLRRSSFYPETNKSLGELVRILKVNYCSWKILCPKKKKAFVC